MAKITYGPLVSKISGKLGDVVFSMGKTGSNYVKMRQTKTTNPSSANQSLQRSIFAQLTKAWDALNATQQGVWNTYAANGYGKRIVPTGGGAREVIHGNTGRGGGKGLYIYVNQNILRLAGTAITAPVPNAVIPDPFATLAAICTGGVITVTGTGAAGTNYGQIWIVGKGKLPHRQIAFDGLIGSAMTFYTVNGGKGTPINLSTLYGQKVYIQAEVIQKSTGLASNPSETVEVTIA
jgi:hypothetical protein